MAKGQNRYFTALMLKPAAIFGGNMGRLQVGGVPLSPFAKGSVDFRYFHQIVHQREIARTFLVSAKHGAPTKASCRLKILFHGQGQRYAQLDSHHLAQVPPPKNSCAPAEYFAAAPIKFVANAEYRFTMHDAWKGAVFLDAGNMWLYNRYYGNDFRTN